jgi:sulfatase maturation enzyme AslB (radical SAM superfamily)
MYARDKVDRSFGSSPPGNRAFCESRMTISNAGSRANLPWLAAPFKLTISVTARCNLACRHCYTDCGAHRNAELTTDEWIRFLDQLIADGFVSVFFEGGEPFTRDDFEAIVAHATAKMFVAVRTNGTLIDAQRAADWLAFVSAGSISTCSVQARRRTID